MKLWLKQFSYKNETINVTLFQTSTIVFYFKRELSSLSQTDASTNKNMKTLQKYKNCLFKASKSS